MNRRDVCASLLGGVGVMLTGCSGQAVPRSVTVSLAQMQEMVGKRFPQRYPVAGLLQFELKSPTLALRPEQKRINAVVPAVLSGPVLGKAYQGQLQVNFALRYEPADHSLRAERVQVQSLSMEGMPEPLSDMLSTYGPRLAEDALEQLSLYQLKDAEISLMDSVGLMPGEIAVTAQGLVIALVSKPLSPAANK